MEVLISQRVSDEKQIKGVCKTYLPTTTARSPLIVPGSDFCGSVAPISFRPYFMTPSPSQTYNLINSEINLVSKPLSKGNNITYIILP